MKKILAMAAVLGLFAAQAMAAGLESVAAGSDVSFASIGDMDFKAFQGEAGKQETEIDAGAVQAKGIGDWLGPIIGMVVTEAVAREVCKKEPTEWSGTGAWTVGAGTARPSSGT